MNIVHVGKYFPPEYGGIETATRDLALAGQALGNDVTCWVAQKRSLVGTSTQDDGVSVRKMRTLGTLMSAPICPGYLTADFQQADVIHIHLPNPLAELATLIKLKKMRLSGRSPKLIPFVHALPVNQGALGKAWFSSVTTRLLKQADRILVSTGSQLETFPELKAWETKAVQLPFQATALPSSEESLVFERRRRNKTIIAVGRLVPYKGFDVLIHAWAEMTRNHVSLRSHRLEIIGDGPMRPSLEKLVKNLGLSGSVRLLGALPEAQKAQRLREAILLAAPSINSAETFGISILEAMGFGLPVITTRLNTGVSLLARDGACGAVVRPGSARELALSMSTLLSDPGSLIEKGRANLAYVREHFSSDRFSERYQSALGH